MVPPRHAAREQPDDGIAIDELLAKEEHLLEPTGRGLPGNVRALPSADRRENLRMLEALLFAAAEPLAEA